MDADAQNSGNSTGVAGKGGRKLNGFSSVSYPNEDVGAKGVLHPRGWPVPLGLQIPEGWDGVSRGARRFRFTEIDICALLVFYAAQNGSLLSTFRDRLWGLSSMVKLDSWPLSWAFDDGADRLPRKSILGCIKSPHRSGRPNSPNLPVKPNRTVKTDVIYCRRVTLHATGVAPAGSCLR